MFGSRKLRHLQQGYVNLGRWASVFRRSRSGLYLNFAERASLDPRIAFTRATSGWNFNSAGTLVDAGSGNPRFDYNPSTLAALGVLEEQASTNLATYSNNLANALGWTPQSNMSVTENTVVAPNGTTTGSTISTDGVGSGYLDKTLTFTNGSSYVWSVFAKANTTSTLIILLYGTTWNSGGANILGTFNLATGVVTSSNAAASGIQDFGNGWYRCWIRQAYTDTTGSSTHQSIRLANASESIYAWGYQVEVGQVPTTYISAPSSSAVTRNLDRFTIGTLTPWFNAAGGTIVARVAVGLPANGAGQVIAKFSDNTTDNTITLTIISTGEPQIFTASSGVFDGAASDPTILVADTFTTIAASYQSGRLEISQNGSAVTADTSFTFPSGMTRLDLLGNHAGASAPTTARLKWLRYYPSAYIGASLQQLASLT